MKTVAFGRSQAVSQEALERSKWLVKMQATGIGVAGSVAALVQGPSRCRNWAHAGAFATRSS